MKRSLFPILCLSLCLAACGRVPAAPTAAPPVEAAVTQATGAESTQAQEAPTPLPSDAAPEQTLATGTITSPPSPTPPQSSLARTRYEISANLDYSAHRVEVRQAVQYPNLTGESLSELVFVVEPNHSPNSFQLTSTAWGDGSAIQGVSLEKHRLTIPLPQPLLPGSQADLTLTFTLDLPAIIQEAGETRPIPFGYSDRQLNLVDWYVYLPPYRPGDGWLLHDNWYFGEHQVYDLADFVVDLTLSGQPANLPGIVLAASAPAEQAAVGQYHYSLPAARTFALSASPYYTVESQSAGSVTVYSYALLFGEEGGKAALQHTVQAVALYQELFGPYPHTTLSIVEADFLDGMEYDGLYFLSYGFYNTYDGSPKNYLTAIAVHETGHEWWYGRVGNDQAQQPWLDEGLSTYMEYLYYERYYPELTDWWWAFRVDFYQPTGFVDDSIYDYGAFIPYRNAVYLRGAQFLHALRQQIGDQAFFAFMADYSTLFNGKIATTQDFFDLLTRHVGQGWQPAAAPYFESLPPSQ